MVLLNLNDKNKEKVELLNGFDVEILNEFFRIAIEFLKKEINNKMLNSAAQKLNMQFNDLKEAIECLMWILVESTKLGVNEKELRESLLLVGFKEDLIALFYSNYSQNLDLIKNYLSTLRLSHDLPQFHDLEWRLDVKLAQRSIRNIIEPEILLNFQLETLNENTGEKEITEHLLQTDPLNLINLTNKLEDALNEIRTNYSRRVFKNLN